MEPYSHTVHYFLPEPNAKAVHYREPAAFVRHPKAHTNIPVKSVYVLLKRVYYSAVSANRHYSLR